jgi:hypothetical protein
MKPVLLILRWCGFLLVLFLIAEFPVPVRAEGESGGRPWESGWSRSWLFLREEGLTGSFRSDYYTSSKILNDENGFFGGTAQFKLRPGFGERMDGKFEARLTNPDIGNGGETDSTVLEGYFTAHFGQADLRIGKQIVVWGRADGINPTDNLTPHDFTVMLPFEDDQRFGTIALKGDLYLPGEMALTLFATPFFEPSKIPLPASSSIRFSESKPVQTFENSEIGLKLDHTGGRFDWSVSYYHGVDLLPDARIVGMSPSGIDLELRHNRIDVFGADAARNFGRYGFRAEAAYVLTEDREGEDPTVKNPFFFYVLGVDRTFFENLNINLQLTGRWVANFNDPEDISDPVLRAVAIQNAIFDQQQERMGYGLTSRVGKKWFNDTLEAEILAFINFQRTNSFIRPLITYAFTDHLKGTFGGEIYTGPDDSFFGRLHENQGIFTELRYSF